MPMMAFRVVLLVFVSFLPLTPQTAAPLQELPGSSRKLCMKQCKDSYKLCLKRSTSRIEKNTCRVFRNTCEYGCPRR
jgi:hypothetical protein